MVIDLNALLNARTYERSAPAAADAVGFAGGLGVAVGVLMLSGDLFAHDHGRWPGIALFAVLVAVGYLALGLLPREIHPAAVTLIVTGIPGAIGWWILPGANSFGDVRGFLILTILLWAVCFVVPRTRGRTIFVGAALILLWLWVLGEVAGLDSYSAAPVPSPPAHTIFSLSALHTQVTIDDLDTDDPLYPLARQCDFGIGTACDTLYDSADAGSDFETFGDTCGNTQPSGSGDQCADLSGDPFDDGFSLPDDDSSDSFSPFPGIVPRAGGDGSDDKTLEIGIVSLLFGIVYVGALWVVDRRRWHGLGTAFVIPGFLALFTGTQVLGEAADHLWVGGLLTLVGGIAFALVGDLGGRRFTAWAGGVFAGLGVYLFAGDVTNFEKSFGDDPNIARPAFITIAFGIGLVALAWVITLARSQSSGSARSGGSPPLEPPPDEPLPVGRYPLPTAPEPQPGAPWQPPVAPPAPAPWQPPPAPPPSPPWQPPPAPPPAAPPPAGPPT
jgi:hypothetical protein